MEKKHPNDMTESEIREWQLHPEWADWVNIKQPAMPKLTISPNYPPISPTSPPSGAQAFFLGVVFLIIGTGISLFSVFIGNIGLAVSFVGLFCGLFGIYQAITRQTWQQEQYQRMHYNLPK